MVCVAVFEVFVFAFADSGFEGGVVGEGVGYVVPITALVSCGAEFAAFDDDSAGV